MKGRDKGIMEENSSRSGMRERGGRKSRRWSRESIGLWGFLTILLVASTGVDRVYALPLAQAGNPTTTLITTSTSGINGASPGPTLNTVTSTTTSDSSSGVASSSKTTSTPGTVVTDSPLVKTKPVSSESSIATLSQNLSSIGSASGLLSTTASTTQTPTILPSPSDGGDDGYGSRGSPDEKTYNSLVNFYFLILAGVIGFAV